VAATSANSRAYSSDDDARAFLQQRLRSLARLAVILIVVMALIFNGRRVLSADIGALLLHPLNKFALAQALLWGLVWQICATGKRSLAALRWIDGGMMVFFTTLTAPMALVVEEGVALVPETHNLTHQLALLLVLRAVYVPSTWLRTAVISSLSIVPGSVVATILYQRYPQLMDAAPLGAVIGWLVAFALCATLVSGVIYGLRRQAHDALQLGQYRLEAKIGEGGMGTVYRASHAMLRRKTAVKLLPPDKAGEASVARFEREVQQTAQLTHPNTVAIYDYGRTPDGVFYYVMELLDGLDLEALVERDGPQPAGRVIHLLQQVSGALAEAHDAGLTHRDIKPANIIVCQRGGQHDVAKVVDFGLVKVADSVDDSDDGAPKLSNVNVLTGTPLYLSPEAISDPESVDARSDIYALGAVAFFGLTGEPPFSGKGVVEVCSHHLHTAPDKPSERRGENIDDGLDAVVLRCLAKAPGERYQTAAALQLALNECDAAGDWDAEIAREWWRSQGGLAPGAQASNSVSASLVIDFKKRGR